MQNDFNFDFIGGELLLVDKPVNWTSFDVVNKLRSSLRPLVGKLKVGHSGTLDPLATGLLILCTGKFTKKLNGLQGLDKEYTGIITLGATRPSFDMETEIDQTFPIGDPEEAELHNAATKFVGEIEQVPPVFSAIKVNGQALYKKARKGEAKPPKARNVVINALELTKIELPDVHFRVHCGKGTYIRSLAHDFGKALNNGGYLKSLRRTKIGDFDVKDAYQLDELIEMIKTEIARKKEAMRDLE